jgi:ketopantoate reductase
MSILVVGAGPLGQAFAAHLHASGSDVAFLVKPGQKELLSDGTVYRLKKTRRPAATQLRPNAIYEEPAAVAQQSWEMVWLCVQSAALTSPAMQDLRDAAGDATIVSPGQHLGDRRALLETWPESHIVQVVPQLLAFDAAVDPKAVPGPGVAYWVPPGAATKVVESAGSARARAIAAALRRGGLRRKVTTKLGSGELAAAVNMPAFVALEQAGWSLDRLGERTEASSRAARQAAAIVAAVFGLKPPSRMLTSPGSTRRTLRLLARLAPFDFEAYAEAHFGKIRGQNAEMFQAWIDEGQARGLPVDGLTSLRDGPRATT